MRPSVGFRFPIASEASDPALPTLRSHRTFDTIEIVHVVVPTSLYYVHTAKSGAEPSLPDLVYDYVRVIERDPFLKGEVIAVYFDGIIVHTILRKMSLAIEERLAAYELDIIKRSNGLLDFHSHPPKFIEDGRKGELGSSYFQE